MMQSLFCKPCEKAALYPADVGSYDHRGQVKTRLIQVYFSCPKETSSAPAQLIPVGGWAAVPFLGWQLLQLAE